MTAGTLLQRRVVVTVTVLLIAGLFFLVANADLPVLRNSVLYAKAAQNIVAHRLNPFPVIADANLSFGKPMAFSMLATGLVEILGVNTGIRVASYLGTAFFLWVAYLFFIRVNSRLGIDSGLLPIELGLLFFNPLMLYQFWSGYPDSLFAGLVLLAFVLTDRIAREPERDARWAILGLGGVIYAAILTKLYGLILGIACPVYLLIHIRNFRTRSRPVVTNVAWLAGVFAVLGVTVVLARLGWNPSLNFGVGEAQQKGVGYTEFVDGLNTVNVEGLLGQMGAWTFALLLTLNVSLLFLGWHDGQRRWPRAWSCFVAIFVLGLVPFGKNATYNIRYIMPLFPFAVAAVVDGMRNVRSVRFTRFVTCVWLLVASVLTLNFNSRSVFRVFGTVNEWFDDWTEARGNWLESLRMPQHLWAVQLMRKVNRVVEPGGTLIWTSTYYPLATYGMVEQMGLRPDIHVHYAATDVPAIPPVKSMYLPLIGDGWKGIDASQFHAVLVATGILRLEPHVFLVAPADGEIIEPGMGVELRVAGSPEFRSADYYVDGMRVASDDGETATGSNASPHIQSWTAFEPGRHEVVAVAHLREGRTVRSNHHAIFVGVNAIERPIRWYAADAEELSDGTMVLASRDLDLVEEDTGEPHIVAVRFTDVQVPAHGRVDAAFIQLVALEESNQAAEWVVHAELSSDPLPFTEHARDLSSRRLTAASVHWSPYPWSKGARTPSQRSPDLSSVVQEVIDQPGWRPGSALVLTIRGSGRRVAISSEAALTPGQLPRLYVEYGP